MAKTTCVHGYLISNRQHFGTWAYGNQIKGLSYLVKIIEERDTWTDQVSYEFVPARISFVDEPLIEELLENGYYGKEVYTEETWNIQETHSLGYVA